MLYITQFFRVTIGVLQLGKSNSEVPVPVPVQGDESVAKTFSKVRISFRKYIFLFTFCYLSFSISFRKDSEVFMSHDCREVLFASIIGITIEI